MNPSTVKLKIEGMTCSHCVAAVERALAKTIGVISKSVNLETGTAEVAFDSVITSPQQVSGAVNQTGIYKASILNNHS